jgi:hypothetical protein
MRQCQPQEFFRGDPRRRFGNAASLAVEIREMMILDNSEPPLHKIAIDASARGVGIWLFPAAG